MTVVLMCASTSDKVACFVLTHRAPQVETYTSDDNHKSTVMATAALLITALSNRQTITKIWSTVITLL